MRLRIVVFMGGQKEHASMSSQSGKWLCQYIPRSQYDVTPVHVGHDGTWKVPLGTLPKTGDVARTIDMLASVTEPQEPTKAMERLFSKPVDSIITVLRGKGGDDGAMHGMGNLLKVRVTGSGYHTSQIASHKHRFAHAVRDIAPTPYSQLFSHTAILEELEDELRSEYIPPFFIKPATGSGSHGIIHVQFDKDISRAIRALQKNPQDVVVQESLPGIELTVTVFSDSKGALHTLPPTIVTPKGAAFYDYHTKQREKGAHFHSVHESDKTLVQQAEEIARDVYSSLNCSGIATVDMIADGSNIDVLELNTIPTFHTASPIHHQLQTAGMHPEQLIRLGFSL